MSYRALFMEHDITISEEVCRNFYTDNHYDVLEELKDCLASEWEFLDGGWKLKYPYENRYDDTLTTLDDLALYGAQGYCIIVGEDADFKTLRLVTLKPFVGTIIEVPKTIIWEEYRASNPS